MSTPDHLRKGWCPGALRPMRSGDGLLLRIRPRAGALPVSALAVLAEIAEQFGSGEIEITNRANVQLRGLDEATYARALARLDEAKLIDLNVAVESVRNIIVDPSSGLAPSRADVRGLAEQLERLLASNAELQQLPGKFGFSLSGDANPQLGGRSTDIMLATPAPGLAALTLDGDTEFECLVAFEDAVRAIGRLAQAFLDLSRGDADGLRMSDAVARYGGAILFQDAGIAPTARSRLADVTPTRAVGRLTNEGKVFAVGFGFPFGRVDAASMRAIYGAANTLNIETVRISSDRGFVFPVSDDEAAEVLLALAHKLDFVSDADDPRLRLDVCSGAPGCANATTRTREDAAQLIAGLGAALEAYASIHISGCQKGCAHRGAAALTLVARDGRYDAVFDGGPADIAAVRDIDPKGLASALSRAKGESR